MNPTVTRLASRCFIALTFGVLAVGVPGPTSAVFHPRRVNWSQPIGFEQDEIIGSSWSSNHTQGRIMADDFTFRGPIVYVRFWGSYRGEGPDTLAKPRDEDPSKVFDVSFYGSGVGSPDELLVSYTDLPVSFFVRQRTLETFVGINQDREYVYIYEVELPRSIESWPEVDYFLAIDDPSNEGWGWQSVPAGPHLADNLEPFHEVFDWRLAPTGPQLATAHSVFGFDHDGAADVAPVPADLAFVLLGYSTPEPSTLVLAVIAALGLSFYRRRRQRV